MRAAVLTTEDLRKESAVVLVIGSPITARDVPALCERARAAVQQAGGAPVVCDVAALVDPDFGTVDALARLQLTVKRLGSAIALRGTSTRLDELLALAGLREVLPLCPELRLEPVGESEEREQALGIEEEADPGDLAAREREDL